MTNCPPHFPSSGSSSTKKHNVTQVQAESLFLWPHTDPGGILSCLPDPLHPTLPLCLCPWFAPAWHTSPPGSRGTAQVPPCLRSLLWPGQLGEPSTSPELPSSLPGSCTFKFTLEVLPPAGSALALKLWRSLAECRIVPTSFPSALHDTGGQNITSDDLCLHHPIVLLKVADRKMVNEHHGDEGSGGAAPSSQFSVDVQ